MNPTLDLLTAHRSIRAFTPDPVPAEHLAAAIRAGQAASTSSAVQAYCAIHIIDPGTRREIAELAGNQPYVESAPAFLVLCADTRRHRFACQARGTDYDTRLEAFLVATIDTALFAQNVAVALESLGYGVCFLGGIRNDLPRLDALLALPHGVYPLFGMCIGKPDPARPTSQRPRLPTDAVLMHDRYHDDDITRAHMRDYDTAYRQYLTDRSASPDQVAAAWAPRMGELFAAPRRTGLAAYYAAKGARLD
jgi:nitroreductase